MENFLLIMKLTDSEWELILESFMGVYLLTFTGLLLFALALAFSPDEPKLREHSWIRRFSHYFLQMQKMGVRYYLLFFLIYPLALIIRASLI